VKRLLALAGVLWLLVGCVEVDQRLDLRADGSIALEWRLGLFAALARGPWAKPDDVRAKEFAAMVPDGARDLVRTRVDTDPERIWLVLEADLPDAETYAAFRDAFIARYEADYERMPFIYPPVVERWMGRWHVLVDIPARVEDDGEPGGNASARWRLRVRGPAKPVSNDADRIDADGALVWEMPMSQVVRQGLHAHAVFPGAGLPLVAWAGLAGAVALGGVGIWRLRGAGLRARPSA
jgi:hypothetical protein